MQADDNAAATVAVTFSSTLRSTLEFRVVTLAFANKVIEKVLALSRRQSSADDRHLLSAYLYYIVKKRTKSFLFHYVVKVRAQQMAIIC